MLLLPIEILDRKAVDLERGFLIHPLPHVLERDLEQLGVEPGLGLFPARKQDLDLLSPSVDRVVTLILVVLK